MMSIEAGAIQLFLKLFNAKNLVYRQYRKPARNTGNMNPEKIGSDFLTEPFNVNGFPVITIKTESTNRTNKHIIFLHGGAYLIEASSLHRKVIETFAKDYNLTISFIDYPKAPEHTFRTTHKIVLEAYLEIVKRNPDDEFFLFGDSAGGGLALAFLQVLRDNNITPYPGKTVLASPWLDITMENDDIKKFEKKDALLLVKGLRYAANKYAWGEDQHNPLLSPIFGDLSNLGHIKLFVGSHEVFYPDCMKLAKMVENAEGTNIEITIGEKMMHDWGIMPITEGKETIHQMAQFFLR